MRQTTPLFVRFLDRLPFLASGLAAAVALVGGVGWWTQQPAWYRVFDWAPPMRPQSAVAAALASVALLTAAITERRATLANGQLPRFGWLRAITLLFALLLAAVAVLGFGAHRIPGGDALERLFFRGGHAPQHLRLALNTTVAYIALAISLAMLAIPYYARRRIPHFFAGVAFALAFVAFTGYAFGVAGLYRPTSTLGMSVGAVIAFHALSLGVIFTRRNIGFPALVTDSGAAGRLSRRLLPAAVAIPFAVAWVVGAFVDFGYVPDELATSLVTVLTVGGLVWIVTRSARVLQRADVERAQLVAREQHEREVAQQALIAAETASSAKSDFLAVMSHELRTPLTAIIGYEELLADEITGTVNAQQAQQLSRIKASAQHLLGLIDEILTFSRLEAGRETIRLEAVSINRLVEEAANLVAPLASEKKLGFAVYLLDPPRVMRTDPGKVRQILVNLLSNSVKFTQQGGVTLVTEVDVSELIVRVRDTGAGIAPENLERVFDAFWQAEQKATRRAGGTGLGLTVTRRLARLLGGDVTVESNLGEGAVFTVRLPGVMPTTLETPVLDETLQRT